MKQFISAKGKNILQIFGRLVVVWGLTGIANIVLIYCRTNSSECPITVITTIKDKLKNSEKLWKPQEPKDQTLRNSNRFPMRVNKIWSSKFKLELPN